MPDGGGFMVFTPPPLEAPVLAPPPRSTDLPLHPGGRGDTVVLVPVPVPAPPPAARRSDDGPMRRLDEISRQYGGNPAAPGPAWMPGAR